MGIFLASLVVFLLFVVISQFAGYYRSRLRVAGTEGDGGSEVRTAAGIGIAGGLIVLALLLLLFVGFTRWQWLGPPPHSTTPPISTPAPPGQGAPPIGVNVSPAPSPPPSPKPSH